ncbi:MAG: sigma-70 family RNA polymerase sigma factor [Bacillota bacterium]
MQKDYTTEEIESILSQYKPLVLKLAKGYYIQGGDIEDLIQEGMIALYGSIFSFDETKSSFQTYAYICISSRLKNVVKHSFSKSQRVLSDADSLDDKHDVASDFSLEEQYILKEEMSLFRLKIQSLLSDKEFEVVELFLKNMTYEEIATACKMTKKSVDNALSRAKKKIAGQSFAIKN